MTYYYAHTKNEKGEWHYLNDHLNKVADYAKGFAKGFYKGQVAELAEFIGLLHDLGKVNPGFQDYLLTIDKGKPAYSPSCNDCAAAAPPPRVSTRTRQNAFLQVRSPRASGRLY